ncbi:hypothetical protein ABZP36_031403 [Zizania latifolia]
MLPLDLAPSPRLRCKHPRFVVPGAAPCFPASPRPAQRNSQPTIFLAFQKPTALVKKPSVAHVQKKVQDMPIKASAAAKKKEESSETSDYESDSDSDDECFSWSYWNNICRICQLKQQQQQPRKKMNPVVFSLSTLELLNELCICVLHVTKEFLWEKLVIQSQDIMFLRYHNVNINVTVQTEHGLFIPVIRDADKKGLGTIVKEGGTFTISNLGGPFGIKQFCAIINPPQSAILAIGSAEKRMVPNSADDQYEFGSFMSATMSCDHRVIDGTLLILYESMTAHWTVATEMAAQRQQLRLPDAAAHRRLSSFLAPRLRRIDA